MSTAEEPPLRAGAAFAEPEFEYRARPSWLAERAEYGVYMFCYWVARLLGMRATKALVDFLGGVLGPRVGFAKRAHDNFDLVRPGYSADERRRIVRGVYGNFAQTGFEYAFLQQMTREAPGWRVVGVEHFQAAREAAGGRLVIASAHFGNWEALRAFAAAHGAPLGLIYRAFNNKFVDQHIYREMTKPGWAAFRKGAAGGRALFKHVRSGQGALILVDQRLGGAPIIDFMGQPAETSVAAAQLARTLKAPLLTASAKRVRGGFEIRFDPPVPSGAANEMMAEVNRRIGAWVDEAPEQWFWVHRRWKMRSAGRTRKFDDRRAAPEPEPSTPGEEARRQPDAT